MPAFGARLEGRGRGSQTFPRALIFPEESQGPPMPVDRAKLSATLAPWVGIVAAVTGGWFGLSAYNGDIAKRVDDKITAPFDLASEFHNSTLRAIRSRVFGGEACRQSIPGVTQQELVALVDFFDRVDICMKQNLCDPRTTRQLFEPYANIFGQG